MPLNDTKIAAVPKKYEGIDFKPPASVAKEAEKGLEYRRESGKGGLSSQEAGKEGIGSGVQRAVNLKNRNNIAPGTIQQMLNFFSRHEKNKSIAPENKNTPWEDAGYVAWLLWGGDAGRSWAEKIKKQMEAADEKEAAKTANANLSEKELTSPLSLQRDYGSLKKAWGPLLPNTKTAGNTGEGTEVGIFIPLPEELSDKFPPLSRDSSKPHVTFLYVGDVKGREKIFLEAVKNFFLDERGPLIARLSGVDYFRNQTDSIAYSKVHFSTDMGAMRDRLASRLEGLDFKVENRFPLSYTPHVTLAYMDDPRGTWKGEAPTGEWHFHTMEIWGLPEVHSFVLGPKDPPTTTLLKIQRKREVAQRLLHDWYEV